MRFGNGYEQGFSTSSNAGYSQKDLMHFEVNKTEIYGLQEIDQMFPAHPCRENRDTNRIPHACQKSNAMYRARCLVSKDKCIHFPQETIHLFNIIFQKRDGRLQSTKGYHHPLTLLGTATSVLNESQVYICYTKGWKVSKAHNSGLVILGKCTNGREEDVCFSSSTPLSTYSLSLSRHPHAWILLQYRKKQKATCGMQGKWIVNCTLTFRGCAHLIKILTAGATKPQKAWGAPKVHHHEGNNTRPHAHGEGVHSEHVYFSFC